MAFKKRLFQWLVDYHCTINFSRCLKHLVDDKIYNMEGLPYEEGKECEYYQGVLIVANGKEILDLLMEDEIILSEPEDFTQIENKEDFFKYILKQENKDGAYIYNGFRSRITKVRELNNNPKSINKKLNLYEKIPRDFVSYSGVLPLREIGVKTRLAIKIPYAYEDAHTFQIKRSAFTDLGIGKVTHFSKQGLVEEFFLTLDKEKATIIGIYRKYNRDDKNELIMTNEKQIDVFTINDFDVASKVVNVGEVCI